MRTALSQVHQVAIALRSFLEPAAGTGDSQGRYYFIPVCSIDTAVIRFYGTWVKFVLFIVCPRYDDFDQTLSSEDNLNGS